jgi:ABC-type Na+ efflux pump permease subunit
MTPHVLLRSERTATVEAVHEVELENPIKDRPDWRQICTLYRYEVRAALREKAIVVNSILIPILLYPLIMWVSFSGIMFIEGQSEKATSRVAVSNWPSEHPALRARFEHDREIRLVQPSKKPEQEIKTGAADAVIMFAPPTNDAAALPGNFRVQITFDQSRDRSEVARTRVAEIVDNYRADWLKREGRIHGITPSEWEGFVVNTRNVASGKQMGGFLLGLVLPVLFVVMVAAGCFYPAIDSTAGERERNTWETLISSAASRQSIVIAKYLYVATFGGIAGALNLVAMTLTVKPILKPLLQKAGASMDLSVPFSAIPIIVLAAALLAGFVAAGMMIFASFARTFKEGQAMIMPFYMLVILPVLFLQVPGMKFSLPLAFVPIANVTMMVRAAISGTLPWLQTGVTILVSLALIALCLRFAAFILRFEDVTMGSYSGGFNRFFKERVLRRNQPAQLP